MRIIPYQEFGGDYLGVLRGLPIDCIPRTPKRLLILLNEYAFKNGECYPSQNTLARRMDLSVRQVQRVLKFLEDDGWMEIERPSPLRRHLYGQNNRYFFLWREEYGEAVKKAMSPENEGANVAPTIKGSKSVSPQEEPRPQGAVPFVCGQEECGEEDRVAIERANELAKYLDAKYAFPKFQAGRFARWAVHHFADYPAEAVAQALEAIDKKAAVAKNDRVIFDKFDFWGYGVQVVKSIGANLKAERDERMSRATWEKLGQLFGPMMAMGRKGALA